MGEGDWEGLRDEVPGQECPQEHGSLGEQAKRRFWAWYGVCGERQPRLKADVLQVKFPDYCLRFEVGVWVTGLDGCVSARQQH